MDPAIAQGGDMSDSQYLEIKVWKRRGDDTVILYRCLKDLESGKFAVQSADFFSLPIDAARFVDSDKQFLELLMEVSPRDRCEWFPAITDAIRSEEHTSELQSPCNL